MSRQRRQCGEEGSSLVAFRDSRFSFNFDGAEKLILFCAELVHFHEFEQCEEGDDDFDLGGGFFEERLEVERSTGLDLVEEILDLITDGEAIIDDVSEVARFLKSTENVLKSSNEVENGDFSEWSGVFRVSGFVFLGGVGKDLFLLNFALGEEICSVFKLLILNELSD